MNLVLATGPQLASCWYLVTSRSSRTSRGELSEGP